MLMPDAIAAAARTSLEMHRTRARYRPFDAVLRAAPLEDAYRIQDALHRLMGGAGRGDICRGVPRAPLEDAYRIQDALHRLMGEAGRGEIAGWKIALTSKAMQQMTGVD